MKTRLTFWEYDELLEHLSDREDIWTHSEENELLWMRSAISWETGVEESLPAYALLFNPPKDLASPYRIWGLDTHTIGWTADVVDSHVERLLEHWTSYGQRKAASKLLTDLNVAEAELVAIALASLDWTTPTPEDPEGETHLRQEGLWPDTLPPLSPPPPDPLDIGTYLLQGGMGWIRLRLAGGMIRITTSIQNRTAGGGFGSPMDGFVRPRDGRVLDAASSLAGRTAPKKTSVALPVESVLEFSE